MSVEHLGFASGSADAGTVHRFTLTMPQGKAATLDEVVRARIAQSTTLDQAAHSLFWLLSGGHSVWLDGTLNFTRVLVAEVGRLRIVIHTREHGPPHFHVTVPSKDIDASFAIENCGSLAGTISNGDLGLVRYWHASARPLLIQKWNETRPL
jgi:hypothetical protein